MTALKNARSAGGAGAGAVPAGGTSGSPAAGGVSAADVAALLGDWPSRGSGSLAARLAFSLRSRILADLLPPGTLLPAERPLAEALAVSRSTLVAALDLLRSDGLITSRQGSGTWVTGASTETAGYRSQTYAPDERRTSAGAGAATPTRGAGPGAATPTRAVGPGGATPARAAGPRRAAATTTAEAGEATLTMAARLLAAAERGINFGISAPPAASALPPLSVTSADLLAAVPAHGYDPAGLLALRVTVAERHSAAGLPTTAEQIAVTHGAHHAIDLALATLCQPGDPVAVEDPTYPGVLDVITARRLRPVPLPADSRGPTPAGLETAARDHGARLAFLLPAVHNPTGRVLDPGRRQALSRTLDKLEMTVVEDNTLADLTYEDDPPTGRAHKGRGDDGVHHQPGAGGGKPPSGGHEGPRQGGGTGEPRFMQRPPSLAALCRRAVVVSAETTSKVAWGGLRIGWLRAPAGMIERSIQLRTSGDLGCSVPAQLLALQLLEHYDELIATRRAALAQSATRFADLLAEAIPGCSFDRPAGGLSLWVRLPGGADAAAFASRALRHGVSVAPGQFASPTGGHDHLRLCHDRPEEELVEGTARLAAAWSETSQSRPPARPVRP